MWRETLTICWTDDHGVWIEIAATKEWLTEQELIEKYNKMILEALDGISIKYDRFSNTHSEVHEILAQNFFNTLSEKWYIEKIANKQTYCDDCEKFLPDRYIEWTCPKCSSEWARWDQCESCWKLLDPIELIKPECKICHWKNISTRDTYQYSFKLSLFEEQLRVWLEWKTEWKENIKNTAIKKWLWEWLEDRSISRDIKWGIPIPWDPEKKMYVWFEAPLWYISFLQEYSKSIWEEDLWKDFWGKNSNSKVIHFIWKDNIVFHTIIWPAMLMATDMFKLPTDVPWNEFLNLEWKKISTSKNHAVWLHEMLDKFNPEVIRFYLTFCIPENKDSNFSWSEFIDRNNELANTLWNLVNRTLAFSKSKFNWEYSSIDSKLCSEADKEFINTFEPRKEIIIQELEKYGFKKALQELVKVFIEWNKYFNDRKPRALIKENPEEAKNVINITIQYLFKLSILMEPFLPNTWKKIREQLGIGWTYLYSDLKEEYLNKWWNIWDIYPLFKKLALDDIGEELTKLWISH